MSTIKLLTKYYCFIALVVRKSVLWQSRDSLRVQICTHSSAVNSSAFVSRVISRHRRHFREFPASLPGLKMIYRLNRGDPDVKSNFVCGNKILNIILPKKNQSRDLGKSKPYTLTLRKCLTYSSLQTPKLHSITIRAATHTHCRLTM